jgi:GT2 family glycosyltransferase
VCYNAHKDTVEFIKSVNQAVQNSNNVVVVDIIVCDNSDENFKRELLIENDFPFLSVKIMRNSNVGYFPAFSKAILEIDSLDIYDFISISNVDLTLSLDFFTVLNNVVYDDSVGVIAPSIISNNDGRDLNPKIVKRPSILKIKILKFIFKSDFLFSFHNKMRAIKEKIRSRDSITEFHGKMFAPHGSFIIFTNQFFSKGGDINYPRFLFGEETFVGEKLLTLDLDISHNRNLIIYDREHGSTSQQPSKFMRKHHILSYEYYLRELR